MEDAVQAWNEDNPALSSKPAAEPKPEELPIVFVTTTQGIGESQRNHFRGDCAAFGLGVVFLPIGCDVTRIFH